MFTKKKTCGVCGYRVTPTKEEIYIAERDDADESEVAEDED